MSSPDPAARSRRLTELLSVALLLVLVGVCLLALSGTVPSIAADTWDFRAAYLHAGELMRTQGGGIYDMQTHTPETGPFIYPPASAAMFGFFSLLPTSAAVVIWVAVLFSCMVVAFACAYRLAGSLVKGRDAAFIAVLALATFGAFYADVTKANINSMVIALMLGGLLCVERGRERRGGALLAAAAFVKVLPVVLVVWLVANKRWRALQGWAIGAAFAILAPLAWTVPNHGVIDGVGADVNLHVEYVQQTVAPRLESQEATGVGGTSNRNASINAALARLFLPDSQMFAVAWPDKPVSGPLLFELPGPLVKGAALLIALAMFGAGAWASWKFRDDPLARLAGAGLVFVPAMLGNLLCWPFHFVALLLVAAPALAWGIADKRDRRLAAAILGLTFVAVTAMFRLEAWWFRIYGLQTLLVIAAWGLTLWMLIRRSRRPAEEPAAGL
ncbi:MAG: DUF2029 domain-containing protein [Planctomycetes bacterium]|nr:DUF2029 domain-containing protein [Planctomycetota bacterium]